jgi:hypothetical protein
LPKRLIHAGWVLSDREAMDKFYKDVLGFHVYWHGGMKEGETNLGRYAGARRNRLD